MPVLTAEDRLGTLFAGRYKLEEVIGAGGMGVVFRASHFWTGRDVAVKLLKPHLAEEVSLVRRFLQEARAASDVPHENVVQVFDMGAEDDGTVYLVMELLEGESLAHLLADEGTLSVEEALQILVPVMDALSLAHDVGIIHRDLKPENILLHRDRRGRRVPKLLDFGVSKLLDPEVASSTMTGLIIGTPSYMSPEQAEAAKDQGPGVDVWSMGVVLFRCLSGRLPFKERSQAALLVSLLKSDPPSLSEHAPEVPAPIAAVVDGALRRDRDERWADMPVLLLELSRACGDSGIPFPVLPSHGEPPPREDFEPGPRNDGAGRLQTALRKPAFWAIAATVALIGGTAALLATPDAPAEEAAQQGEATGTAILDDEPATEVSLSAVVPPTTAAATETTPEPREPEPANVRPETSVVERPAARARPPVQRPPPERAVAPPAEAEIETHTPASAPRPEGALPEVEREW